MRESVTGDDVFAQILMMRTADQRTVLLVEGPDDHATLSPHLDEQAVTAVPCHGNRNLDRAIALADADQIERVLAIRDRDFIGILDEGPISPNVVLTDLYDLDATIFCRTSAGSQVIAVFGHEAAQVHCVEAGFGSPVDAVAEAAAEIGRLRLSSEMNEWSVSTRDLPVWEILEPRSGRIDRRLMLTIALARSTDVPVDAAAIERDLATREGVPAEEVVCGHDVGRVLSAFISRSWGASKVGASFLLQAVRAALACADLHRLELYQQVCAWEQEHDARVWLCEAA